MKLRSLMISFTIILGLAFTTAGLIKPPTQNVFKMTINIEGIKTSKGKIKLSLQSDEKLFNTEKGIKKSRWKVAKAKSGQVSLSFNKVKPGIYAIAVFHDENDNDSLDKDLSLIHI